MLELVAEDGQQLPRPLEALCRAADHHDPARASACDGRVDETRTLLRAQRLIADIRVRPSRAGIDNELPSAQTAQHPVAALHHRFHRRAAGETEKDEVRLLGDLGRRSRRLSPQAGGGFHLPFVLVENGKRVIRFEQCPREPASDVANADQTDPIHHSTSCLTHPQTRHSSTSSLAGPPAHRHEAWRSVAR